MQLTQSRQIAKCFFTYVKNKDKVNAARCFRIESSAQVIYTTEQISEAVKRPYEGGFCQPLVSGDLCNTDQTHSSMRTTTNNPCWRESTSNRTNSGLHRATEGQLSYCAEQLSSYHSKKLLQKSLFRYTFSERFP